MGDTWLRQKCTRCSGWVAYLPHWSARPKHCVRCRLLEIDDFNGLFEWYLGKESRLRKRLKAPDEKLAFAEREGLRTKVTQALQKFSHTQNLLAEACTSDRELSGLAFRLAKERRLANRPSRGSKKITPKTMAPFYQGGAPGLGKKSS
jgi:hypothetical protein